jgi:hypothetical protein
MVAGGAAMCASSRGKAADNVAGSSGDDGEDSGITSQEARPEKSLHSEQSLPSIRARPETSRSEQGLPRNRSRVQLGATSAAAQAISETQPTMRLPLKKRETQLWLQHF